MYHDEEDELERMRSRGSNGREEYAAEAYMDEATAAATAARLQKIKQAAQRGRRPDSGMYVSRSMASDIRPGSSAGLSSPSASGGFTRPVESSASNSSSFSYSSPASASTPRRPASLRSLHDDVGFMTPPSRQSGKTGEESSYYVEHELEQRGISPIFVPPGKSEPTPRSSGSSSAASPPPYIPELPAARASSSSGLGRPGPGLDFELDRRLMMSVPLRGAIGSNVVQCYVRRERSGFASKFYPRYFLHLASDDSFLLSAKKRKKNKSSNYVISLDKDDMKRQGSNFVGKLRSNFVGTEFTIFDSGENPNSHKSLAAASSASSAAMWRSELGGILYETNILGTKGPRRMTVVIPDLNDAGVRFPFKPMSEADAGVVDLYKEGKVANLVTLRNKKPQWNDNLRAYVLNFGGRVTKASVKNFQLVDDANPTGPVYLQFGKVEEDLFNLDFAAPLCPLQAFAIALSAFDNKLACE